MKAHSYKKRFDLLKPAEDITELLKYLKDTYNENQVFRGQTCHYGNLLPSCYRSVVKNESLKKPVIQIEHQKLRTNLDERDKIKINELSNLISFYDSGIGNILAQQYGLTSEAIDITMNPEIAAFFATKKYPQYKQYSGTKNNRVGVIYRFSILRRDYVTNLAGLDLTLSLIGRHMNGHGHVWFLKYTKRSDLSEDEINDLEKKELQHGQLITHPAIVPYRSIKRILAEFYEDPEYIWQDTNTPSEKKKQAIPLYRDLEKTRIARQEGGFIVPPKIWLCSVPYPVKIERNDKFKLNLFVPSFAVANTLLGVENLLEYPYLESFFFKHSVKTVDKFTPGFLWPSVEDDPFFKLIAQNAISNNEKYLKKNSVEVFDRMKGIIDRGYYN